MKHQILLDLHRASRNLYNNFFEGAHSEGIPTEISYGIPLEMVIPLTTFNLLIGTGLHIFGGFRTVYPKKFFFGNSSYFCSPKKPSMKTFTRKYCNPGSFSFSKPAGDGKFVQQNLDIYGEGQFDVGTIHYSFVEYARHD